MSSAFKNIDMGLDDIIKISKAQKRQEIQAKRQQRGRGRGQQRGGIARGRGQVLTRGRGRGGIVRGRGRGKLVAQGHQGQVNTPRGAARGGNQRGRGRGLSRQNAGVSPLNRLGSNQNVRGRGRGRAQGAVRGARGANRGMRGANRGTLRGGKPLVFTNSGGTLLTAKYRSQQLEMGKSKQAAKLLREKELALQNLQQAKLNMQNINQALQKSSRDTVVNQRRGIVNDNTQQAGRGRKKLLSNLMRGNQSNTRQLINTSVTITNPTALNVTRGGSAVRGGNAVRGGGKRRGWRRRPNQAADNQQHFTIQVANQNSQQHVQQPVKKEQSSILDQLKLLKPTVATVYKFQKNVFATPATGISLNDRFAPSSSSAAAVNSAGDSVEGRKVYM